MTSHISSSYRRFARVHVNRWNRGTAIGGSASKVGDKINDLNKLKGSRKQFGLTSTIRTTVLSDGPAEIMDWKKRKNHVRTKQLISLLAAQA